MMELSRIDNDALHTNLEKTFPNKVNIGFGLDESKIKGVKDFPVYYESRGFVSHAKNNLDSVLFHVSHPSTRRYDVKAPGHSRLPDFASNLYDKKKSSMSVHSDARVQSGLSKLYGLPAGRDIVLENPTAQAMGKITAIEFRNEQWRKEAASVVGSGSGSGLPAELDEIINRSHGRHGNGSATASSSAMDVDDHLPPPPPAHAPAPAQKKRSRVVEVQPAFDGGDSSSGNSSDTTLAVRQPAEVEVEKLPYVYPEIKQNFKAFLMANVDRTQDISRRDRDALNTLLQKFGFKTPRDSTIKISSYITAFRNIIRIKKSTDTGEAPLKKKKGPENKRKKRDEDEGEVPVVSQQENNLAFEVEAPTLRKKKKKNTPLLLEN
jgi:hypothetical protein